MKKLFSLALAAMMAGAVSCDKGGDGIFKIVDNGDGATLGYSPRSGIKLLKVDGYYFKDLNKNGALDAYEDWRLPAETRAKDLAGQMSIDQIAGLMLYSGHQSIPGGNFNGQPFTESGAQPWELSDQQKKFLEEDNLRHVLITRVESPEVAARWNNEMQSFVEGLGLGIPGNNSSDPRHAATITGEQKSEYNEGSGGTISVWPDGLGIAATFDPSVVEEFGRIASQEYRALGIATALSPQIDLGTEPRWSRVNASFGEHPYMAADMSRAYADGFQTSTGADEIENGWGYKSVNAMVKHWPGGGAGEAGRDGHYASGKFAVYPGNNFATQLIPFTEGAFKLNGKTGMASAVMPYYTISWNQAPDGTNVANAYSKYIITDLLRGTYGFDGVVCTDWNVTHNESPTPSFMGGKPWGLETLTEDERHYVAIMVGVDQFGGNNDKGPVLAAYQMGVAEHGEEFMRARMEQSAVRLLKNIFRVGLFENPYLDPAESARVVGNPEFMKAGYDAQLKSIVVLKNKGNVLPVTERKTVYIPKNFFEGARGAEGTYSYFPSIEMVERYFDFTEDPAEADFAIVFVRSPAGGTGYEQSDRDAGGNGYLPISLQYRPYTATYARAHSLAAGDPVTDPTNTNRSYKGKSATQSNEDDLDVILATRQAMGGKPVIVVPNLTKPMVFSEFEGSADAIVARFGVSEQAVLDIISGKVEPSGLLPIQMPASMRTVEENYEDTPFDVTPHRDSEGNSYDFGFGLNWGGRINDARTAKYQKY